MILFIRACACQVLSGEFANGASLNVSLTNRNFTEFTKCGKRDCHECPNACRTWTDCILLGMGCICVQDRPGVAGLGHCASLFGSGYDCC